MAIAYGKEVKFMAAIHHKSIGEKIFDAFNYIFMLIIMLIMIYPCYYVLVASFSDPVAIYNSGGLIFYPKGFATYSYGEVVKSPLIWTGYRNTLLYVLAGGFLSVMLTITAAFSLTRRNLPGQKIIMFLIMFTMYFSGGLIPTFLVVKSLGITDTFLAMILPGAVSTFNLIITITYFRGLPYELEEAAEIDGANDYQTLFLVMMPLAKPILAVISLYYVVGIWNNYFTALIYINNRNLYPLQLVLREILIQNDTNSISVSQSDAVQTYKENVKYATIVVSTVPILFVYPFLQRYFVKGVMVGAIKA